MEMSSREEANGQPGIQLQRSAPCATGGLTELAALDNPNDFAPHWLSPKPPRETQVGPLWG